MTVTELVAKARPSLIDLRRRFHRRPELSYQEVGTSALVEEELRALGLNPVRPTSTSVMATIATGRPGPVLALRADLDALPVQEATGLEFASANEGVMHACGHDGHLAVLLTTARIVASMTDRLGGEVRLIFQHAEEQVPSGAPELVAAGVLDGADAIAGLHLWTPLPTGAVAVPAGPLMASTDYFDITVRGRGGHAGLPHQVIDAVAIGAQIVGNLQHVVARETDPLRSLVVSVTGFHAGELNSIVPETATLHGTIRAFDEPLRRATAGRVEKLAAGIAAAHGAETETVFRFGPPAVINDASLADVAARVVRRRLGAAALVDADPVMAGEDFACYQQTVPGVFVLVGAGTPGEPAFPHHHPRFDIDEEALPMAVEILTGIVTDLCG